MPVIIFYLDIDLEGCYQAILEYWDNKYHRFPTEIPAWAHTPLDDRTEDLISRMNVYANHLGEPGFPE